MTLSDGCDHTIALIDEVLDNTSVWRPPDVARRDNARMSGVVEPRSDPGPAAAS